MSGRGDQPSVPASSADGSPMSATKGICPICSKPRDETYRPFCSKRCRDIDLSRWLTDAYAIAGSDTEPEEQDR